MVTTWYTTIGPYYSTDQLLNVISFSMLRQWLPVVYPARSHISRSHTPVRRPMSSQAGRSPMATPTTPDRGRSPAIATPTSFNKLLTPIGPRKRELKHIAVQYCLRILDQWERSMLGGIAEEVWHDLSSPLQVQCGTLI